MRKILLVVFAIFCLQNAYAQDGTPSTQEESFKPYSKPDFPGSINLEFGFNFLTNSKDSLMKANWFGSRVVGIYYQRDFKIGKSKFSFHPGIGLSLERYKMDNQRTLSAVRDPLDNSFSDQLVKVIDVVPNASGVIKSMIVTNYVEIPLELRYSTNASDPNSGFKFGVGGRIGYLFDSHTKLKYKENDKNKILKDKQHFSLTKFRYAGFAKVGISWFNLFGYYNFSPVFESGSDPTETKPNNFTVGITISGF